MIFLKQLLAPVLMPLLVIAVTLAATQTFRLKLADSRLATADATSAQMGQTITAMQVSLDAIEASVRRAEAAQQRLATTQATLNTSLGKIPAKIEAIRHENNAFKVWADTVLPADAARLRERPAIAGAEGYLHWLSGRDDLPAVGDRAKNESAIAH